MTPQRPDLPRIVRYEELEPKARRGGTPDLEQITRLRAEVQSAQQRYSDVLRAFPPGYYEQFAHGSNDAMANAPVVAEQPPDELLDHNYDGIQEYDNPTPGWWHAIFAGSFVFALLYAMVYHTLVPSLPERHAAAEAAALEIQFADLNHLPMGEQKILAIMGEPAWLSRGQAIFKGTCAVCHGPEGAGLVGPNLTDETYKNVHNLIGIADLITTGTANGAMPSQKNILNENEIALVAAYVASLRGKNLPTNPLVNPDYIGVPIDPWPAPGGAE